MNPCPICGAPDPVPQCTCGQCQPIELDPGNMVLCQGCQTLIVCAEDGSFIPATNEQRREAFRTVMEELLRRLAAPRTPSFRQN